MCGLSHQPQDITHRCGFAASVGAEHIYPDLAAGLRAALALAQAAQASPVKCNKED